MGETFLSWSQIPSLYPTTTIMSTHAHTHRHTHKAFITKQEKQQTFSRDRHNGAHLKS